MHPQMQQVFIKYLIDHYKEGIQDLITTLSNEMVRVAGITHLRVNRRTGSFLSEPYDPSKLIKGLTESSDPDDKLLADFYDWFFEIGYSELVFADKAIFYEGDTERLYIRKLMTWFFSPGSNIISGKRCCRMQKVSVRRCMSMGKPRKPAKYWVCEVFYDPNIFGISPAQHLSKRFFKAFGNSKRTFRKVNELYFQSSAAVQFNLFDITNIDYFILRNRAKVLNLLLR